MDATPPPRRIEPLAIVQGEAAASACAAGLGLPYLGGPAAMLTLRLIGPGAPVQPVVAVPDIPPAWRPLLAPLTVAPPGFAGLVPRLGPGAPLVMGIVNVTPDSFSGDGLLAAEDPVRAAIAQGEAMLAAGVDILDIGGESTRPGAVPVPAEVETARILPVIRALAPVTPVSVDTRNAATARAALAAGARILNDVSALRHDPAMAPLAAAAGAPVVLMHMLGDDPRSMQAAPRYADVALEVTEFLAGRLAAAEVAGIPRSRIALDPGIGFGKTLAHNLVLIERLPLLAGLGCPILLGVSRKGFIGRLGGVAEGGPARLPGSLAAALAGLARGAAILRVHDVAATVQAVRVWRAAQAGVAPPGTVAAEP